MEEMDTGTFADVEEPTSVWETPTKVPLDGCHSL